MLRQDRPYTKEEFAERYYSGMTITEMAIFFKIGRKKIQTDMKRFSIIPRVAIIRNQFGNKNSNWKGDKAGYSWHHQKKRKLHGQPKKCEICGTTDTNKDYEWANLTGKFSDPDDYKRMCKSCHSKYDHMEKNFNGGKV